MRNRILAVAITALFLLASARNAMALTSITGTVGSTGKYLLSGTPVNVTANMVLKITFETTTAGVNLALCAGTSENFLSGTCATQLNDSGGPGFTFLTIVDAASLNGRLIYVVREVGTADASFKFTVE